jgi:hypothetical protein
MHDNIDHKPKYEITLFHLFYSPVIFFTYSKKRYLFHHSLSFKEIYHRQIRNIAGHSSVNFEYYPSGAVQKAHFTGHPDGGIQWDDVAHYFDENGIVTQVVDNSSDEYGHYKLRIDPSLYLDTISKPNLVTKTVKETPKKQEVVACAEIYATEFYLINATGKKQNVTARLINTPLEGFQKEVSVAKNDTIKLGNYIEA